MDTWKFAHLFAGKLWWRAGWDFWPRRCWFILYFTEGMRIHWE
ncbi:MAG: hypothetical protein LUC95_08530, partial [Lachnospiraceae bacterium]|nr:hypothetical protein [Lachnospiraceae bacterium]